jgi:hypothetical protein
MTSSKPFTHSLRSDIVLLSAWLSGSQPGEGNYTRPHPKDNPSLNFLTHISNVLTIGHSHQPNARNVNAVSGKIDTNAIHCLIFTENCAPQVNVQQHRFRLGQEYITSFERSMSAVKMKHVLLQTAANMSDQTRSADEDEAYSKSERVIIRVSQKGQVLQKALEKALQEAQGLAEPVDFQCEVFEPESIKGPKLLSDWSEDKW